MDIEEVQKVVEGVNFMKFHHAKHLVKLCHEHKVKKVLEIGTFHGVSACYFGAILEELGGEILTVDTQKREQPNPNLKTLSSKLGLNNIKQLELQGGSAALWNKWELKGEAAKFDLVYIDGNHFLGGVLSDWLFADKFLSNEGLLIFDDYLPNPKRGIQFIVDNYVKKSGIYEELKSPFKNWYICKKKSDKILMDRLAIL